MRRSPFVVAGTAAGLGAVLGLHIGAPATLMPVSGARATADRQAHGGATANGSAPPAGSSGSSSAAPAPASASGGSAVPLVALPRTAVGASQQYGYGVLSVRVTVRGTQIQSVAVERLQTADQYSQQLAAQVIPMLRSQVLSAQSAHINGISGASYTSQAYAFSVQSALDKLHVA